MWRKRLHHLASSDLREALGACVVALEALDHPDTALLCSVYEALARTLASPSSSGNGDNAGNLLLENHRRATLNEIRRNSRTAGNVSGTEC